MLREQMISFLEATVIFLLLTNALSISAAAWAIYLAARVHAAPKAIDRRIGRLVAAWDRGRNAPSSNELRIRSH